jgi:L-fuconolactonase
MYRSTPELLQWYAAHPGEDAIEADIPIVDPHHHLFGSDKDLQYYRLVDYMRDLSGGHRIVKTVYVEAYRSGWKTTGPDHLRSVGETEWIISQAKEPLTTRHGQCEFAAGLVANIDLTQGAAVIETLDAHLEAGQGRLRGVRQIAAYDDGLVGRFIKELPPVHLLKDARFRAGFSKLKDYGLSFDVWVYHKQLDELISLVDAFPDTTFILDHLGGLMGVGPHRLDRGNTLALWKFNLRRLAERPNVYVKVGGMGMPVYGFNFEHQPRPATSQELATAWRPLIETCIAAFGPKRCMFESNFPVDRQSAGYTEIWNAFKTATRTMSSSERNALFFETASRAYRLD